MLVIMMWLIVRLLCEVCFMRRWSWWWLFWWWLIVDFMDVNSW